MGSIVQGAGGLVSAAGTYMEGQAAKASSEAQAGQMERNAGQLRAQGQFEGEEELRKARLVQSRILAVAGASGAGVIDPTVLNLVGTNAAEGSLAAATRRYNAETRAQDTEYQAQIKRMEGRAHAKAATWRAAGTALSSFGGGMSGGGTPPGVGG